ncbi:hypothetical protein EXIGLDRAFT_698980 [Exidia glandulosa HHB12029]|uniref:Uncharacterized protein n=1 Tax=Exidia glandulosa HHB12029 TaxID=1314781 RepID=A0A165ZUZ5_EXIGL|nr:hypothetical protein EXIGLDRAFT_698980 [Exidia glandulosa HHB12029]
MLPVLKPLPEEVWVRITQWCIATLLQVDQAPCLSKERVGSVLGLRLLSRTSRRAVLCALYGKMLVSCTQGDWLGRAITVAPFLPTHTLVLGVPVHQSLNEHGFFVLPHAFPDLVSLSVVVCACRLGPTLNGTMIERLLRELAVLIRRLGGLERLSVTVDFAEFDTSVDIQPLMDAIEQSKLWYLRLCLTGLSIVSSRLVSLPESLSELDVSGEVLALPVTCARGVQQLRIHNAEPEPPFWTCASIPNPTLLHARGNTALRKVALAYLRDLGGRYNLQRLSVLKLVDVPVSFTMATALGELSDLTRLDLHPSAWLEWPVEWIADEGNLVTDMPDLLEVEAAAEEWHDGAGNFHMDAHEDDGQVRVVYMPRPMEWEDDARLTLSPMEALYTRCFLERFMNDLRRLRILHIGGAMDELRSGTPSALRLLWEEIWSVCAGTDLLVIGFGPCEARPSTHRHIATDCSCRGEISFRPDCHDPNYSFRLLGVVRRTDRDKYSSWQSARTACVADFEHLCGSSPSYFGWMNPRRFFPLPQPSIWTGSVRNTRIENMGVLADV